MAKSPLCARVAVPVDEAVRALGSKRSNWLRRIIESAAQRELMGDNREAEIIQRIQEFLLEIDTAESQSLLLDIERLLGNYDCNPEDEIRGDDGKVSGWVI